jgi:hypothetical protein
MPATLAQAALNTLPDVDFEVIDNLRRYSWLLDQIVFDDTVNPGTGGGTLTYGYTQLLAARSAAFRAYNAEYTPTEATRQRLTVDLKPLGGQFGIDRAIARLGPAASNEISFQLHQLLVAIRTKFQNELINGDTTVDANGFNGLSKTLTGTATEYLPLNNGFSTGYLDWTRGTVVTQALGMAAIDVLDDFLSGIVPSTSGSGDMGMPGALPPGVKAIIGNTKSIARVRSLARWAGLYTAEKDDLGRQIEAYGPWTLVNIGDDMTGANPIVPIQTRDTDGAGAGGNITNVTDLYAVSFGLDAFHAASVAGNPLIQVWMPDYEHTGAVKNGEMEMGPLAMVLKNTKACGVLRNVKVA